MSEGAKDTLRNVVQNFTLRGQSTLQMLEKNEVLGKVKKIKEGKTGRNAKSDRAGKGSKEV